MKKAEEDIRRHKKAKEESRRLEKFNRPLSFLTLLCFLSLISLFFLLLPSSSLSKEYDGIWFLGFNLNKKLFQDLRVRQAVIHSIDRNYIITKIVTDEIIPISYIPRGMPGYRSLPLYKYNPRFGKTLMRRAKYPILDKRLKNLSLLHTDGLKTSAIARKIQKDIKKIGMKIKLVEVSYRDEEKWVKELSSRKYDMFFMGFKAGIKQLFTEEARALEIDSYDLLEPLFETKGEANFMGYRNPKVDQLFAQIEEMDVALKKEREEKFKQINKILHKDLPVVILFYIEKL